MLTAATALVPVFLLIVMGYALKQKRWVDDAFWAPAERMTYYIFFPALLIGAGARADLGGEQVWPMALSLFAATLTVALAAIALKPVLGLKDAAFTSFFQGSIRPNTYVGVVGAFLFWGDAGLAMISIGILAVVPLVNLLSVTVLVLWGSGHEGPRTPAKAVRKAARNPLVIACLIGFGLNALGLGMAPVISSLLDILGRAALPIALMAVGAGLDFPDLVSNRRVAAKAAILKLLALPAIAWGLATLFGVEGQAFQVTILYATMPVSASSYVLAREMGGDAPLMAGIITATTIAAMVTMALWIVAAG